MLKVITAVLMLLALCILVFFRANKASFQDEEIKNPLVTPDPTGVPIDTNLKDYVSPRYGYSFSYPDNWHALLFDETNKDIINGTHTFANYDFQQVEKFIDHGIVDWNKFVGDQVVIKFDLSAQDLKDQTDDDFIKQYFPEGQKQAQPQFTVGNLNTAQYNTISQMGGDTIRTFIAFHNSIAIFANVNVLSNPENIDLESSTEWQELEAIFSTFKFN